MELDIPNTVELLRSISDMGVFSSVCSPILFVLALARATRSDLRPHHQAQSHVHLLLPALSSRPGQHSGRSLPGVGRQETTRTKRGQDHVGVSSVLRRDVRGQHRLPALVSLHVLDYAHGGRVVSPRVQVGHPLHCDVDVPELAVRGAHWTAHSHRRAARQEEAAPLHPLEPHLRCNHSPSASRYRFHVLWKACRGSSQHRQV